MAYELFIGDYAYSSWSLRGWLVFKKFGIDVRIRHVDFMQAGVAEQLTGLAPAKTVPTLAVNGVVIWDSLAIAEEIASRHPDARLWPDDPALRATGRSLASEMHASFGALREDCPMNLRAAYSGFQPSEDVRKDLGRLEAIWGYALDQSNGPWLCGSYSIADIFYAPVAARIAGYGLQVSDRAQAYVDLHLNDLAFRQWRALGLAKGVTLPWYARDYTANDWPGPVPIPAKPLDEGTPENNRCPYSGDPVTHLMEVDRRIFGMCNAVCRDKTVADPEAWPQFVALLRGT